MCTSCTLPNVQYVQYCVLYVLPSSVYKNYHTREKWELLGYLGYNMLRFLSFCSNSLTTETDTLLSCLSDQDLPSCSKGRNAGWSSVCVATPTNASYSSNNATHKLKMNCWTLLLAGLALHLIHCATYTVSSQTISNTNKPEAIQNHPIYSFFCDWPISLHFSVQHIFFRFFPSNFCSLPAICGARVNAKRINKITMSNITFTS